MYQYFHIKEKDYKHECLIVKLLLFAFIPVIVIPAIVVSLQHKSVSFLEKEYFEIHTLSYSGIITKKLEEKSTGRTGYIVLNTEWFERKVPFYIYREIEEGDSLVKLPYCDSEWYIKQNGEKIERDLNSFFREKYFSKLCKE